MCVYIYEHVHVSVCAYVRVFGGIQYMRVSRSAIRKINKFCDSYTNLALLCVYIIIIITATGTQVTLHVKLVCVYYVHVYVCLSPRVCENQDQMKKIIPPGA